MLGWPKKFHSGSYTASLKNLNFWPTRYANTHILLIHLGFAIEIIAKHNNSIVIMQEKTTWRVATILTFVKSLLFILGAHVRSSLRHGELSSCSGSMWDLSS